MTAPATPPPAPLAHGALLASLAAGRERYLAFARRRLRSEADADDVLQQAMLRAAERIGALHGDERLDAWFYRILRNVIADHHVRKASQDARFELLDHDVAEATPAEVAVCACTLGLLGQIRPEYTAMLQGVDLDERSLSEVAQGLQITPNNAKVRLHRARKALREALVQHCGACSARACADCSCDQHEAPSPPRPPGSGG